MPRKTGFVVIAAQTLAIRSPGGQVWSGLLAALVATAAVFGIATSVAAQPSPDGARGRAGHLEGARKVI
ncbi:MAG TPA: hypothetical protein VJ870_19670 [Amycolatopsis sp.]|nr:hypothetical protein [Amycolatopsis sp.]